MPYMPVYTKQPKFKKYNNPNGIWRGVAEPNPPGSLPPFGRPTPLPPGEGNSPEADSDPFNPSAGGFGGAMGGKKPKSLAEFMGASGGAAASGSAPSGSAPPAPGMSGLADALDPQSGVPGAPSDPASNAADAFPDDNYADNNPFWDKMKTIFSWWTPESMTAWRSHWDTDEDWRPPSDWQNGLNRINKQVVLYKAMSGKNELTDQDKKDLVTVIREYMETGYREPEWNLTDLLNRAMQRMKGMSGYQFSSQ